MSGFLLHLNEATHAETIRGVSAFVGEDASGQFGIRERHERFMTIHTFGLARFRVADAPFEYLAVPGGLVYFVGGELFLCARRLFRHRDPQEVARALTEQLAEEEQRLSGFKQSLRRLEDEMLKRMWQMGREHARS